MLGVKALLHASNALMENDTPHKALVVIDHQMIICLTELTENMIRWAEDEPGSREYAGWCLSFIEDALEEINGIEIFGGNY